MESRAGDLNSQDNFYFGGRAIFCPWNNKRVWERPIEKSLIYNIDPNIVRQSHEDIAGNILRENSKLLGIYNKLSSLFETRYNRNPEEPRAKQMFCVCADVI